MVSESLIKASADLARVHPELWQRFMVAFEEHVATTKDAFLNSPENTLSTLQGHAREAATLLKLFRNCVKSADAIRQVK